MYEREETLEFEITYGLRRDEDGSADILTLRIGGDGGSFHHPDDALLDHYDSVEEAYDSNDYDMFVFDTLYAGTWDDTADDDEVLRRYFESPYGAA